MTVLTPSSDKPDSVAALHPLLCSACTQDSFSPSINNYTKKLVSARRARCQSAGSRRPEDIGIVGYIRASSPVSSRVQSSHVSGVGGVSGVSGRFERRSTERVHTDVEEEREEREGGRLSLLSLRSTVSQADGGPKEGVVMDGSGTDTGLYVDVGVSAGGVRGRSESFKDESSRGRSLTRAESFRSARTSITEISDGGIAIAAEGGGGEGIDMAQQSLTISRARSRSSSIGRAGAGGRSMSPAMRPKKAAWLLKEEAALSKSKYGTANPSTHSLTCHI